MNFQSSMLGNSMQSSEGKMQLNNVEILYTKVQKVFMKPQYKEERQRELRVNVEIHAGISPVCRKSLCVCLSDDEDPCFLFSLLINDDDFKILKAQQGLLVDFDNFATQLICLLEQCHVSAPGATTLPPKFLLLLAEENGEWICKLVETNNFKHLCHLSLSITPASDSNVKTHMAIKIKQLKENLVMKNRDFVSMEARLNALTEELEIKTREYEQLEQNFFTERSQLQMTSSHQLSIEKDRLAQAKLEWQRISDMEKLDVERRHSEILKQLHTDLAELRAQNMSYKDKQSSLTFTNGEQAKQIQNLETELNVAQRELSQLQKYNSKLEVDFREKDETFNDLKTRVAVLEQELKDKAVLISKHTEMLKTAKEQKQQLEELLNDKENHLQRKHNSFQSVSEELKKTNETIQKLQNELSTAKAKLKLRTNICLEQERLLDTKQKEIGQLETKTEEYAKEQTDLKTEIEKLESRIKELELQVEHKEKKIKDGENVISWLNRRLADNNLPPHGSATPTAINLPPSFQLTLPRTNKFLTKKFEVKTPISSAVTTPHYIGSLGSGLALKNSVGQNLNINQISRNPTTKSANNIGVMSDNTVGLATFSRNSQITSTSTPMERMNIYQKLQNPTSAENAVITTNNNNNIPSSSNLLKTKTNPGTLQGGLRRAIVDKPLLPSAYFPKSQR